jgi:hypothetical protein
MSERVANQDRSVLRRVAFWGGVLTWIILCATFVGLLGGTHPGDASRDRIISVAAGLIAVLTLPSAVLLARRIRFITPIVAKGRIFVAANGQLYAFTTR